MAPLGQFSRNAFHSRALVCKNLYEFTAKIVANALSEFLGGQEPGGFDDSALAVDPFRFNVVEPRTLGR